jgi:hypothetical protein
MHFSWTLLPFKTKPISFLEISEAYNLLTTVYTALDGEDDMYLVWRNYL